MKMLKGGYIGWEMIDELGCIVHSCCGLWLVEADLDELFISMNVLDEMAWSNSNEHYRGMRST